MISLITAGSRITDTRVRIIVLSCAALLLLAQDMASSQVETQFLTTPGKSVGEFAIGDQYTKFGKLGRCRFDPRLADRVFPNTVWVACPGGWAAIVSRREILTHKFLGDGVTLMNPLAKVLGVFLTTKDPVRVGYQPRMEEITKYRTKEGLGVSSKAVEVTTAYGKPDAEVGAIGFTAWLYHRVGGLYFEVANEEVVTIGVYNPANW